MNIKLLLLLPMLTFCGFQTASAHDTWLLPKVFRLKAEQRSQISFTSGMAFPRNEHAIKSERVEQAFVLLAGEKTQLAKRELAPKSLEFPIMPPNVGVATVFINLQPKTLDLKPRLVREYLAEIGASDSLKAVWKKVPNTDNTRRWRESYTKHAKTHIFIGAEANVRQDSAWKQPCGMALEIVAEAHPGLLRAKTEFPVRVLLDGKALPNFPVGCLREGSKQGTLQTTDAEGRVSMKLLQKGRYLLRGTLLKPATTSDMDWQSHFTTLTIEVL
jgi:hypothetical protein